MILASEKVSPDTNWILSGDKLQGGALIPSNSSSGLLPSYWSQSVLLFDAPLFILFQPSPWRLSGILPSDAKAGNSEYVPPHRNNRNCFKNAANTSNPRCSLRDLLVEVGLYIWEFRPESEGIPHSFKIKLTWGKTCPSLQRGGRTGKALCRCCSHALTHIVTGWTQTSRGFDTPYFPCIEALSVEAKATSAVLQESETMLFRFPAVFSISSV